MLTIKLPIFRVHQVPGIFWEDGIMSGYQHPKSSALDCIFSSFQMTNETVNNCTHFLVTWYFMCRVLVLSSSLDFCQEPYHWPLLVYLLLVCRYPFASSCTHAFSSVLVRTRHICYFCDYGALGLYSTGCVFACGACTMPDHWVSSVLQHYFVPTAAFNSFVCTGLSCYSHKVLLTAAFVYPFLCNNIPLFYQVSRSVPGQGSGHSHQLFHVCTVLGTLFQLEAILCDVCSHRAWLRGYLPVPRLPGTFGTTRLALLGNATSTGAFAAALPQALGICQPPKHPHRGWALSGPVMLWGSVQ
ncbi:LOW QUALITY PROTEIN: membrane progestin receptor delta [Morus bassanus]